MSSEKGSVVLCTLSPVNHFLDVPPEGNYVRMTGKTYDFIPTSNPA